MSQPGGAQRVILPFLRSQALFAELSNETLTALTLACRLRQVPKNSVIFFQSDPADAAYVVYSGSVVILLTSADGRELVINEMRAGQCFGELSLITASPRSTGAVAREKSELIVIPRQAFLAALDSEPKLVRRLLEMTAERLYSSSERESALAFLDAPGRLARVLLLADHYAQETGYVTISQDELAQRTGLTRQTVAKILGRWRRAGWLLTGRGRIMLLKRDALKQIENFTP